MDVHIQSNAKYLLLVPLSSRTTLYLRPGEVSGPVNEAEISQNPKVAKLASTGLITVQRPK